MSEMVERAWAVVAGWESRYEVSNDGLVRKVNGELVGQWPNDQGYMMVRLSGPRQLMRVHRLVAIAFIRNPLGLKTVNHKDFNRSNNLAANLEWCTQAENLAHSDRAGRMQRDYWKGKRGPNARVA